MRVGPTVMSAYHSINSLPSVCLWLLLWWSPSSFILVLYRHYRRFLALRVSFNSNITHTGMTVLLMYNSAVHFSGDVVGLLLYYHQNTLTIISQCTNVFYSGVQLGFHRPTLGIHYILCDK